jgi:diguanylate cyclase (GGDEF)-like protein
VSQISTDRAAEFAEEPVTHHARFRFSDPVTEQHYRAAMQADARLTNRVVICVVTVLIDLFWIPELLNSPELIKISFIVRFFILSPLVLIFIILDIKNLIYKIYGYVIGFIYAILTVLVCIVAINATSPQDLPNIQAIPLIMLAITAGRLNLKQTAFVTIISVLSYTVAILNCRIISPAFLPSMMLTSFSIGVGAMAVSIRLELRERTVFLLYSRAERRNQLLSDLVRTDALTGVANRRSFQESLELAWSEAWSNPSSIGLIMIDVDHFKAFNDHYGHQEGDVCLRKVAQAVQAAVRSGDLVARYGGEEFAVILADSNLAQVQNIADRILQEVRAQRLPHEALGPDGILSVSLGAASLAPREEHGSERLVELADSLLYAAKEAGRDRVICGS